MAYNIDIKSFVRQWNKIHEKTKLLLKDKVAVEPIYMLFSIDAKAEEGEVTFEYMASIMNNDPQYIQTVRQAINKKPHLSVIQGENGAMLMLCLVPLA